MSEKRKLVGNSLSLLVHRLTQSITTFILTAVIARVLGAEALGQYLLAFSYYFLFVTLVSQGLKTLLTRELSRQPKSISTCLVSGTLLQLILSCIGYLVLVILILALPYSTETSAVCCIMGLAIIPFALSNITESVFQAQERMHLIAIAAVPVYILRLLLMLLLVNQGYGVRHLTGIYPLSELLVLIIEWLLIMPTVEVTWEINYKFMWQTVLAARTFFVIEGVAVLNDRIQILVLSLLGDERLVGLYGGIAQLMQPFLLVVNSVVLGIFPNLSKAIEAGQEKQRQISEDVIEMLLCIALPLLIGILFFAKDLLNFVYGDSSFGDAAIALQMTAVLLLASPFNRTLSYVLVASGMERTNLVEVLITTTLGGISGVFLISSYGLIGAVLMDGVMKISALGQYTFTVWRRLFSLRLWKLFRRPLLLSGFMTPVFLGLQQSHLNFLFILLFSTTIYCLATGILVGLGFGIHRTAWAKLVGRK